MSALLVLLLCLGIWCVVVTGLVVAVAVGIRWAERAQASRALDRELDEFLRRHAADPEIPGRE